jgi:hypothetical protein
MDNGFTITGTGYRYCTKNGSDLNAGTGTSIPYLTFSKLLSVSVAGAVLRSGHYTADVMTGSATPVYGDGFCVVEGFNPSTSRIFFQNFVTNLTMKNFSSLIFSFSQDNYLTFINILSITQYISNSSIYINSTIIATTSNQCILKNSVLNAVTGGNLNKSIITSDSVININSTTKTSFATNFISNCFNGILVNTSTGEVGVVPQAVDLTGSGTGTVDFASRTGSYPNGATDWMHNVLSQTATVCYITKANFNADPLFRNPSLGDFSVSPSSPVIGKIAGQIGRLANIGSAQVTSQFNDFSGDTLNNITNTGGKYTVTSGSSGTITSGVKTIDVNYPKPLGEINLAGEFNFNIDSAGGTSSVNENVPRIFTYYKQGVLKTNTNPRLSIKVRTSNKNTTPSPTTDADWDNNSINGVYAGDWIVINIKNQRTTTLLKPPLVDQNGYGDATDEFDILYNGLIYGKYYQYMIELHNDNTQG